MITTEISINKREVEEILKIINKFPDCNNFNLVHEDSGNGIGSCLSIQVHTTLHGYSGSFLVNITDEKDW